MSRPARRNDLPTRLRHSGFVRWLAIVVLLFQVVLSADHLGASAAAAFGPSLDDEALGILSLCHADGSSAVADLSGDGAPKPAPVPPCVLCSAAALAGVGLTSAPPVVAAPSPAVSVETSTAPLVAITVHTPLRYGTLRGPPRSLV